MTQEQMQALHKQYKDELFESVIPFWLTHSPDSEYGGYFSCLEKDGTVFDTDKFAWMQGREIWMFAKLCSLYGSREEWHSMAKQGVDFMRAHAMAPNGDCYFSMDRTGQPLVQPYNIFSDCFLCVAYLEYFRVSGEEQAKEDALALYRRIQQRKENPKGEWTKPVAGARNLCAMAMPMIQMMMAREFSGILPEDEMEAIVKDNMELLFSRHVDREKKCVFERVLPDGGHMLDIMEGRLLNPGHALEILWFAMDIANSQKDTARVQDIAEIMLWCIERGWDEEYGGIFYYQDYLNYPTDKLESSMKLWWVHVEALCAFLLAYKLTGRPEHEAWFFKIHEYTWSHFPDPENGEWYGYLDRQGNPALTLKGGKWKGFYHLPRMLYQCEQWLKEMME